MLIGVGGFIAVFVLAGLGVVLYAVGQEGGTRTDDIGHVLEKANAVARYADQRLESAALNEDLPGPPQIVANQDVLRAGLLVTLVSQVLLLAVVGIGSKQGFRELVVTLGLNRFSFGRMWLSGGAVVLAYIGTFLYSLAAEASGISWLQPNSTVPFAITREDLTMSIAAVVTVIGAPFSEELFFRGFVFSGLLRWGFWPAAAASALLFALVHFDPGSLLPFFSIGLLMAWLYWRRGSLWDAIVFHFLFNALSFSILVAIS